MSRRKAALPGKDGEMNRDIVNLMFEELQQAVEQYKESVAEKKWVALMLAYCKAKLNLCREAIELEERILAQGGHDG